MHTEFDIYIFIQYKHWYLIFIHLPPLNTSDRKKSLYKLSGL
jgi:hypothetical protein